MKKNLKLAVLSGKGGTGKTFVSVNLAAARPNSMYLDCDVEEPNGHLFFKPEHCTSEEVTVKVPHFDYDKCTGCRKCTDFCTFNALAFVAGKPKLFDGICHHCGACSLLCKDGAIKEIPHPIGVIEIGHHKDTSVVTGMLNLGEASGVPLIHGVFEKTKQATDASIIDCPPGSACTVVESISAADFCLLVAEPSIFGLHNFKMVHELVQVMNKPYGIIINKDIEDPNPIAQYCQDNHLPIIARFPYSSDIAVRNADGYIAVEESESFNASFNALWKHILKEVE